MGGHRPGHEPTAAYTAPKNRPFAPFSKVVEGFDAEQRRAFTALRQERQATAPSVRVSF